MEPFSDSLGDNQLTLHISREVSTAFVTVNEMLISAVMLHFQQPVAPVSVAVDSSDTTISVVLRRAVCNTSQPIAFFPRHVSNTKTRYSAFVGELPVVYKDVRPSCYALVDHDFIIFTDHNALVYALRNHCDRRSQREN
ncbi:hypothetical protein P879_03820 [Paragonimus westermani]|uniref:Reverse transcriptase/retrotransposon-derived protein RNase H-like domain-containing protein n=1 Tax=Paragonimus westermani TaxID=34504 RepID=A0A8T0DPP0_9TREM|nr:hypothetical protein P879_03820 [Paragonimus westermani]